MDTDINNTASKVLSSFINKEKEWSKRYFNLIIHNVQEPTADDGHTRKKQDINNVSSIFNKHMEVKATIMNAN